MMTKNNNYSQLTLEALKEEEKQLRKNENISSFLLGFLLAILIYGIVKNGLGLLHIFLPLLLASIIFKNSKNNKEKIAKIQDEINLKNEQPR
ncbi:MAG: hypothetical protein HKO66_10730 [Saprospiraceae bacterium]|nr:hypothetical protein [Saprospiraceae bacterium]